MVRAEYMTLLLFVTVIYSEVQNINMRFLRDSAPQNQNLYECMTKNCIATDPINNSCNGYTTSACLSNLGEYLKFTHSVTEGSKNESTLKAYNRQEKEIMHTIINLTEKNKVFRYGYFVITVFEINMNTEDYHVINTAKIFNDTKSAQICIPVEPFQNITQPVGVVNYYSHQQFNTKLENAVIASQVIRIEVPGRNIVNLTNPLRISFPVNKSTKYNTYSCRFYDEEDLTWKTDGCLARNSSEYVVECSCNHMTAFAVLLVDLKDTDKRHWEIMSYISYMGCGLSAVFCAFSILTYIIKSNIRKEASRSIHVSLSGALFLLNMSFMLSEWAATLNVGVCVFIAVMTHYSLLCSFTWMAIEALHLYLLLIRVFNIYIRHYIAKLSLIGWGVPAILIGCLLTVHNSHSLYGPQAMTLSDGFKTSAICWTTEPLILYAVNISYFTLIFLFNSGILITVSRKIFMLQKEADNRYMSETACKNAITVLGLMCLLGTTWGLAFFTSGYTNYPILYLFCILNSAQGFFIFLWMCRTARPQKQQVDQKSAFTVDTCTIDSHKGNV